jgi:hypothetical protein
MGHEGMTSSISCMRRMVSLRATVQTSEVFGDLRGLKI